MNLTQSKQLIGVVGGVGPYAGLNCVQKIMDQTPAHCDQEHLPVALLSLPHTISDRTDFLLGKSQINPGIALAEVVFRLHQQGASVVGIPCNTAHAPAIFNEVLKQCPEGVTLLHMIHEVAQFIQSNASEITKIGILSTTGTRQTEVYPQCFDSYELEVLQLSGNLQSEVHSAIYHSDYGIKAGSHPVSSLAQHALKTGAQALIAQGAQAIILGCTEIPLALPEAKFQGIPLIDPTQILAQALIREFSKL